MYQHVKAIALGTVATSIGIMHFDPERDDEDGRYQRQILPNADAEKAAKRELVEIEGEATEEEFKAHRAGFGAIVGRAREVGLGLLADASKAEHEDPAVIAGAAAVGTAETRNYAAGDEPGAAKPFVDPDAAPAPAAKPAERPAMLNQSIDKLTKALADVTDVEELDRLHAAEEGAKTPRDGALAAIDARKAELSKG